MFNCAYSQNQSYHNYAMYLYREISSVLRYSMMDVAK